MAHGSSKASRIINQQRAKLIFKAISSVPLIATPIIVHDAGSFLREYINVMCKYSTCQPLKDQTSSSHPSADLLAVILLELHSNDHPSFTDQATPSCNHRTRFCSASSSQPLADLHAVILLEPHRCNHPSFLDQATHGHSPHFMFTSGTFATAGATKGSSSTLVEKAALAEKWKISIINVRESEILKRPQRRRDFLGEQIVCLEVFLEVRKALLEFQVPGKLIRRDIKNTKSDYRQKSLQNFARKLVISKVQNLKFLAITNFSWDFTRDFVVWKREFFKLKEIFDGRRNSFFQVMRFKH
ncbi:Leucine-rich repeat protein kinase family protein [Forsythia ovata]|uniref:Leucine-rich repeat protein kinase family protein n=1 Tax=Forsythia ovata TaxID=205694 RepID=A0ABD1WPU0_9LAMI